MELQMLPLPTPWQHNNMKLTIKIQLMLQLLRILNSSINSSININNPLPLIIIRAILQSHKLQGILQLVLVAILRILLQQGPFILLLLLLLLLLLRRNDPLERSVDCQASSVSLRIAVAVLLDEKHMIIWRDRHSSLHRKRRHRHY
jgi:hypothetical protein